MPDTRGQVLPVYVLADESSSMSEYAKELKTGVTALCETLRSAPMIASKIRLSILGFSDNVAVRLALADLRATEVMPELVTRGSTNYQAAFQELLTRIPRDIDELKQDGYLVHRPAVFFLSDGQPNRDDWRQVHKTLADKSLTKGSPNIIAFGVGSVEAQTILDVATRQQFAFVSISGADIGQAITKFFDTLIQSVIQSGTSVRDGNAELYVEKPPGFGMAIDFV